MIWLLIIVGVVCFGLGMLTMGTMFAVAGRKVARDREQQRQNVARQLEKPKRYGASIHIGARTLR